MDAPTYKGDSRSRVPHVELHPTNRCIFVCPWCTYRDRKDKVADASLSVKNIDTQPQGPPAARSDVAKATLSAKNIDLVLDLRPESLLICGGGDPTSYHDSDGEQRTRLPDLLRHIKGRLPDVELTVGTHGVWRSSSPDLPNELVEVSHLGISLGASHEASHGRPERSNQDRTPFMLALDNLAKVVPRRTEKGRLTYVSSTFSKKDWRPLFEQARALYDALMRKGGPTCDLNVLFGATSIADDSCPDDPYGASRLGPDDQRAWSSLVDELGRGVSEGDRGFSEFIKNKTTLGQPAHDRTPAFGVTRCGRVDSDVSSIILAGQRLRTRRDRGSLCAGVLVTDVHR